VKKETDRLKNDIVAALKEERWGEALADLEEWCDRFPDHSRSWLNRGYCLYRLARLNEAVTALDRCLEIDPSSTTAKGWRKRALAELDQLDALAKRRQQPGAESTAAEPMSAPETAPEPSRSEAPRSYATLSSTQSGRGWLAGTVVDGRYEVQEVARGGMAAVAIAFDRELRRTVAVKTPLPSVLATADGRARFQREAESWIALGVHPNICCAYYLQEIGGMPRLFIEYVDGGDLNGWLKREDKPDFEQRLDIAIQIASGLDYTHSFLWTDDEGAEHKGVVHRDIKPANVLMTADGVARVTDFGLVRSGVVEESVQEDVRVQVEADLPHTGRREESIASGTWQTVTVDGGIVGTPPYMAPELWRQTMRGTIATDVYAYGCTLYEILLGRRPFALGKGAKTSPSRESNLSQWMRMHLKDEPPDPLEYDSSFDPRLAALMRSCIAKDTDHRPQSFALLRKWLVESYEKLIGQSYPRPEPKRTRLLADSLNNRGASFVTLGLADRAAASFREALTIDPRHLEATFNHGLFEWRSDGLTDAELERRLTEAERAAGGGSRAAILRARLRLLLDDPLGAMEALGAMPPAKRTSLAARRELGFALLARARASADPEGLDEARNLLTSVLEDSPSDITAVTGFAEVCWLLGDDTTAGEALTAARSLDDDLPDDLADAAGSLLPGHRVDRLMTHHAPVQGVCPLAKGWVVVRTADAAALVWEPVGDRPLHRIELGGTARQGRSLVVCGDVLVACLENAPLTLFDLTNGQHLRSLRTHPGVATCIDVAPDGRVVASGGSDRCLRLWNVESGECERTLQGHEAFVSGVAWHPSEPWVVTASADGTVRVWNLDQGRCFRVLEGHRGPVRDLSLVAEKNLVVSAGQDGSVGVWDLGSGENSRYLRGHRGAVTAVAVVAGVVIAGGEDNTVRLWSLETGETLRVIRLPNPVIDLAAVADNRHFLAAYGSSVSLHALPTPVASRLPLVLAETAASGELVGREMEFREHLDLARERIAAGRMEEAIEPLRDAREVEGYDLHEEAVELWSKVLAYYPKLAPRSVVELRRFGGGNDPQGACGLTPGGTSCVAGGSDGTLRRFVCATGEEEFAVEGHEQGVLSVAVSSDGRMLASAGRDAAVRVWNTSSGERLHDFEGHDGAAHAVAFSPNHRAVISAGDDGTVRSWPLDESSLPELLSRGEDAVSTLAVSEDGHFVVSGGWSSVVTVSSLLQGTELRRMAGHEGPVHSVAISPDCRVAASAGEDGTIRIWDLEGGRCWRVLSGHDGAVLAVAFTPDSRFVLSAGKDASLRLWDLRTGSPDRIIEGHAGPVSDVVVSRDGSAAVSAGTDGSLRLWFLDWDPELPEVGQWDDRVRPFLKVFLRRRELETAGSGVPTWNEEHIRELLEDLARRGFGWLETKRVEQELEALARGRDDSRTEEQERTQKLARQRRRELRMAPARELVDTLTRNIGLKVAGIVAVVVIAVSALALLRSPESGQAEFHRQLRQQMEMLVQERGIRLKRGTVMAYQNRPTVGSADCGEGYFPDFFDLAINAEQHSTPPVDPGLPAEEEAFRVRYSNAVNCVGTLGTRTLAPQILQRADEGLHPYRLEDLLSIMIRIGAAGDPRMVDYLADHSETIRHLAALTLVHGGGPDGIEALRSGLESTDSRAVEGASFVLTEFICLGSIEEQTAFDTVRRLCRNIDPRVRKNAVKALILFERSGPAKLVLDEALDDSNPEVVEAAEKTRAGLRSVQISTFFG
jgi:WD40 repeat protein/serine/threonine protein kinase